MKAELERALAADDGDAAVRLLGDMAQEEAVGTAAEIAVLALRGSKLHVAGSILAVDFAEEVYAAVDATHGHGALVRMAQAALAFEDLMPGRGSPHERAKDRQVLKVLRELADKAVGAVQQQPKGYSTGKNNRSHDSPGKVDSQMLSDDEAAADEESSNNYNNNGVDPHNGTPPATRQRRANINRRFQNGSTVEDVDGDASPRRRRPDQRPFISTQPRLSGVPGQWAASCPCGDSTWFYACFCLPCATGTVSEAVDVRPWSWPAWCGYDAIVPSLVLSYATWLVGGATIAAQTLSPILLMTVPAANCLAMHLPRTMLRSRVREVYNIEGSCMSDFCCVMCCTSCAVAQMVKEVELREPRRY